MGHSTAEITLSAADLAALQAPPGPGSRYGRQDTYADRIIDRAIDIWHETESDRHDSANPGAATFVQPSPASHLNMYAHNVDSSRAFVVPIVDSADVVSTKHRVTVHLSTAELVSTISSERLPSALSHVLVHDRFPLATEIVIAKTPKVPNAIDVASVGDRTTIYDVKLVSGGNKTTASSHQSQSEARREAKKLMDEDLRVLSAEVTARVVRVANGVISDALVTLTRGPSDRTHAVEVDVLVDSSKPNAQPIKYVAMFDYHH